MKFTNIHRPSQGTLNIVKRKTYDKNILNMVEHDEVESLGICQGSVIEIIKASDIAEKAANVISFEINGSCPQHMTCLAIIGKTSAVMKAIDAIKASLD